jgi:hypothetical protein
MSPDRPDQYREAMHGCLQLAAAGAYSTHNSTPTQRNAHISANCPASIKETLRLSIGFVVAAVKQKAPVSRRGAS